VLVVPELPDVERDAGPGLVDPGPERIEVGVAGGAAVGRPRVQHDEAGPAGQDVGQLVDGMVEVAQGKDGRGVDTALVIEPPRVVQPLVVGVKVGVQGSHAPYVVLGHRAHGGRVHDRPLHPLFVHQAQPRLTLQVLGP